MGFWKRLLGEDSFHYPLILLGIYTKLENVSISHMGMYVQNYLNTVIYFFMVIGRSRLTLGINGIIHISFNSV